MDRTIVIEGSKVTITTTGEDGGQRRIIPVHHSRTISPDDIGAVLLVDSPDTVVLQVGEVGVEGDTVDIMQACSSTVNIDGPQVYGEGFTLRGQWCAATLLRLADGGWVLFGAVV